MKLIDMKRPKPKLKGGGAKCEPIDSAEKYPWGLRFSFDSDGVKKLPALVDLAVGEDVTVHAVARVIETSARETQAGPDRRVELQIVKIGVEAAVDAEKAFDQGVK